VAAVHAGWRGTAQGIAAEAVARLAGLGGAAGSLIAALGPSIGPCCYAVGPEVAAEVALGCGVDVPRIASPRDGQLHLDLREANRLQLEAAGVPRGSIHVAPWCTSCEAELFFSYRRDGPTGRSLACIGWLTAAP
jgi:YfiH family protein